MTTGKRKHLRGIVIAVMSCCMVMALSAVVFAEDTVPAAEEETEVTVMEPLEEDTATETDEDEESEDLKDQGIEEINKAYDYTVKTEGDSIGASAGISSGGWASLGSELSYMKFPEDAVSDGGEKGVWCYCIDISTDTEDGHKYSMTTLEAARYYDKEAADKIRSILINSYPNIDVDKLGADHGMIDLTEEEAFMATQWILWYYSNPDGMVEAGEGIYYPAEIYKPSDYPKETVTMWYDDAEGNEVKKQSSNVVILAKALDGLAPAAAYETEPADIVFEKKVYKGKVVFDYSATKGIETLENIKITVTDNQGREVPFAISGSKVVVKHEDMIMSDEGAELTVSMEAIQNLSKDVYFFAPEGGRDASQSRVAVYGGTTPVANSAVFSLTPGEFEEAEKDPEDEKEKPDLPEDPAGQEESVTPDEPIVPTEPEDVIGPVNLSTSVDREVVEVSAEPQTGDDSNMLPFALVALAALAGVVATLFRRKKA